VEELPTTAMSWRQHKYIMRGAIDWKFFCFIRKRKTMMSGGR
jgi:hypothetical protein